MTAVFIDDEILVLEMLVGFCKETDYFSEVKGFRSAPGALDYLKENTCDIVFLDIDMPDMDGITLAAEIRKISSGTRLVFVTGHEQYALDAFELHANGYLLKPISMERLREEIRYVFPDAGKTEIRQIDIRTFGNFDVYVDGKLVSFGRSKAKELLAFLVDQRGASVSRKEAFSALWENSEYDRSMQKQFDVVLRSLRSTLDEYGIGHILQMERGQLRVVPETFECDIYRLLDGDEEAGKAFYGEYMKSYSWASLTEAYAYHKWKEG